MESGGPTRGRVRPRDRIPSQLATIHVQTLRKGAARHAQCSTPNEASFRLSSHILPQILAIPHVHRGHLGLILHSPLDLRVLCPWPGVVACISVVHCNTSPSYFSSLVLE